MFTGNVFTFMSIGDPNVSQQLSLQNGNPHSIHNHSYVKHEYDYIQSFVHDGPK